MRSEKYPFAAYGRFEQIRSHIINMYVIVIKYRNNVQDTVGLDGFIEVEHSHIHLTVMYY